MIPGSELIGRELSVGDRSACSWDSSAVAKLEQREEYAWPRIS
jgi:hypothetical protein